METLSRRQSAQEIQSLRPFPLFHLQNKMANKDARDNDASFMEIIWEYPVVYSSASKDFKNKNNFM